MRFLRNAFAAFASMIIIIVLGVTVCGFLPAARVDNADGDAAPFVGIYVIGNGAHTDFVLPARTSRQDWTSVFPLPDRIGVPADEMFVVIGWGQREFYMTTPTWNDLRIGTAVRAAFGGEPALRIDYLPGTARFGSSSRFLALSATQYDRLSAYVLSFIRRDRAGQSIRIDHPGYTPNDAFYESAGNFNALHTCNTWVSEGLHAAGQPASLWTPLEYFVLYHLDRNVHR